MKTRSKRRAVPNSLPSHKQPPKKKANKPATNSVQSPHGRENEGAVTAAEKPANLSRNNDNSLEAAKSRQSVRSKKDVSYCEPAVLLDSSSSDEEISRKRPAKLFDGQTAWFSKSSSANYIHMWETNGGKLVDVDNAMFVFSEDPDEPDTKQLYQSRAYLDEHLAVIHATFVMECTKKESLKEVSLGQFILPPRDLMTSIKKKMSPQKQHIFSWEKILEEEKEYAPSTGTSSSEADSMDEAVVNAEDERLPERRSERIPLLPSHSPQRYQSPEKHVSPTRIQPTQGSTKKWTQRHVSSITKQQRLVRENKKRVKHTEAGYVDVFNLPRVEGELYDFIVGQDGCQVFTK